MLVQATRLIRKMRGGAQAHLLACDDGHFYVVKFRNNPQHRRILINEWIAAVFLNYLQISTPQAAIVNLSAAFLEAHPDFLPIEAAHMAKSAGLAEVASFASGLGAGIRLDPLRSGTDGFYIAGLSRTA